jgi:hypothetical protein
MINTTADPVSHVIQRIALGPDGRVVPGYYFERSILISGLPDALIGCDVGAFEGLAVSDIKSCVSGWWENGGMCWG